MQGHGKDSGDGSGMTFRQEEQEADGLSVKKKCTGQQGGRPKSPSLAITIPPNKPIWQPVDTSLLSHEYARVHCLLNNGQRSLPNNWILLDSCSTINIVRNKGLLKDIEYARNGVSINCNAGNLQVMQQGKMEGCSSPVWFHPECVLLTVSHCKRILHHI